MFETPSYNPDEADGGMRSKDKAANPLEIFSQITVKQSAIQEALCLFEEKKRNGERVGADLIVFGNIAKFYEDTEIAWARLDIDTETYSRRLTEAALRFQAAVNDQGVGAVRMQNRETLDRITEMLYRSARQS